MSGYDSKPQKRCSILLGAAPEGLVQEKISQMHEFLTSRQGGNWRESDILICPEGIMEKQLSFILKNMDASEAEFIFVYVCTLKPLENGQESFFLGRQEIRTALFDEIFSVSENGRKRLQVIFDSCGAFVQD